MFNPRHHSTPEQASGTRRTGSGPVRLVAVLSLLLSASLALAGQPVDAAPRAAQRNGAATVAHTDQGKMTSSIVGRTASGDRVTGKFTPLRVVKRHGDLMVKGVLDGVIHQASGGKSTFTTIHKIPVRKIGGQDVSRAAAQSALSGRATCDILHLVLGPLDLDLLGLQIHLNKVILDIVAVTGAGNLLGNLLCAITGLLDGGPLGGLLSQLQDLLNQILGTLNLAG